MACSLPSCQCACLSFGWDGFCGNLDHFHSHPVKAFLNLLSFLLLNLFNSAAQGDTLDLIFNPPLNIL